MKKLLNFHTITNTNLIRYPVDFRVLHVRCIMYTLIYLCSFFLRFSHFIFELKTFKHRSKVSSWRLKAYKAFKSIQDKIPENVNEKMTEELVEQCDSPKPKPNLYHNPNFHYTYTYTESYTYKLHHFLFYFCGIFYGNS